MIKSLKSTGNPVFFAIRMLSKRPLKIFGSTTTEIAPAPASLNVNTDFSTSMLSKEYSPAGEACFISAIKVKCSDKSLCFKENFASRLRDFEKFASKAKIGKHT